MQRVKLYKLNNEGTWDDTGTGYVVIQEQGQVRFRESNCWDIWGMA